MYTDITKHTYLYLELNGYGDNCTGKNVVFLWFLVLMARASQMQGSMLCKVLGTLRMIFIKLVWVLLA